MMCTLPFYIGNELDYQRVKIIRGDRQNIYFDLSTSGSLNSFFKSESCNVAKNIYFSRNHPCCRFRCLPMSIKFTNCTISIQFKIPYYILFHFDGSIRETCDIHKKEIIFKIALLGIFVTYLYTLTYYVKNKHITLVN